MSTLARIVSIASGFALMGYPLPPATLLATSIVINLALAPLTAVIAGRRGRSGRLWMAAGLAFGMWALAAVLLLRPVRAARPAPPPHVPPTSDAA
jgi:hypothetical protein